MNIEEYKARIKAIEIQAEKDKRQAAEDYALSNNTVSIGDIIEDHIGKIKVEKIGVYISCGSSIPECSYEGTEYTKAGKPSKRGNKRTVFKHNILGTA